MARPVYSDEHSTAKSRLKASFWELLSEMSYSRITVKKLASRANVNPNTFYYHYDTMDSLAKDAFDDVKLHEIPTIIREQLVHDEAFSFSDALEYIIIEDRWKKLRLFITSDSTLLQQHLFNALESFWLSLIGADEGSLSKADHMDLTFILHGAISIMKLQTEQFDLDFIRSLPERPLGQGIMETLERLLMTYQNGSQLIRK